MRMSIELCDDEGQPVLRLMNCHQPELVAFEVICESGGRNGVVHIADVRKALSAVKAISSE